MNEHIPLREACKLIGLKPNTVRSWAKSGKVKTFTTPSNQILYHKQSLLEFINHDESSKEKKNIIYCRVSSKKQIDDLDRQVGLLKSKFNSFDVITDVASGINWKRKGLQTILEYAMQRNLGTLVVAHRDRLSRFGFELIKWIVESNGGVLTVLDECSEKSSEQELAEDLLSIVHVFTCKQMGKRRYKNISTSSENCKDQDPPNVEAEENAI